MSPRTGRPKVPNPKRNGLKIRLDDKTFEQLNAYCQANGLTRAYAIRQAIELLLDKK